MFVKPRAGYVVRDPIHMRPLPPEGSNVPDTQYWFQRLRDGDVEATAPPGTDETSSQDQR